MKAQLSFLTLLLGFTAAEASGTAISLTFSGVASGTLGTTSFTNEPFVVSSQGDTSSVFVTAGPNDNLPAIGAVISISGFAPAVFTDAMSWIDPQNSGDIEFNDATLDTAILGFTKLLVGLETYQFQTSIGPVSAAFGFIPDIFPNFQLIPTSGGLLTIQTTSDNSFEALVAPEPASMWLALTGLGVVFGSGWRLKAAAARAGKDA